MSNAAPLQNDTATPRHTSGANLVLQRKCACGAGASGLTGECAECSKKKLRLQTKLRVNEPGDVYEREADRVAEQVLAQPARGDVSNAPPRIQRYAGEASGQADTAPASVDRVLASAGRPLEPALRQDMEQRFGHDFSRVRVHSGAASEQSARDVNAHAYTVGHNVVFGTDRFAPNTSEGQRLLAHELTHVVQQSASGFSSVVTCNEKGGWSSASQPRPTNHANCSLQRKTKGSPKPKAPRRVTITIVPQRQMSGRDLSILVLAQLYGVGLDEAESILNQWQEKGGQRFGQFAADKIPLDQVGKPLKVQVAVSEPLPACL